LQDADSGAVREVEGPALVELLPGGRVRSVPSAADAFEGTLPDAVLREPQNGAGLMLYAERETDIHLDGLTGWVVGHLYPGAFVSVAPAGNGAVQVGSLPFPIEPPIALFVEAAALGATPVEPAAPAPREGSRAFVVGFPLGVWLPTAPSSVRVDLLPCIDTWLSPTLGASQIVKRVELGGLLAFGGPSAAVSHISLRCSARVVFRAADDLLLNRISETGQPTTDEIMTVPEGFANVRLEAADPLAARVEHGGSVYWLVETSGGIACEQWAFEPVRTPPRDMRPWLFTEGANWRKARLVHRDAATREVRRAWYPVQYEPRTERSPAVIHLSPLRYDVRCDCPYSYHVLGGDAEEAHVMGRQVPMDVVAYDPGDAERWFFSQARCEDAARETAVAIRRDGAAATHIGLHAVEGMLCDTGLGQRGND
jgi:hypothetical protein